jgi:hypothetical protein
VSFMLVGCAADQGWKVAYEQQKSTTEQYEARLRTLEARQRPQQPAPGPQQQQSQQRQKEKFSVAQVIELCNKLNANESMPIGCLYDVTDKGLPYMNFTFANVNSMKQYWDDVVTYFVTDFCAGNNQVGRHANISAGLMEPYSIRIMRCHDGYLTEWQSLDKNKAQSGRY